MIKIIFFDFDGVIVESVDVKTKAFGRLFEPEGKSNVKKVVDYHLKNTGVSRFEKIRHIYKEILKRPLSEPEFGSLCERFSAMVVDEVIASPFVAGAQEFLKSYSGVYDCYVVSATPEEELRDIVKRRRMTGYFKAVFGAPKNKRDMVRQTILSRKIEPTEAAYVGDALSDYRAALENKVHFIARINQNDGIFRDVDCARINDFTTLGAILKGL